MKRFASVLQPAEKLRDHRRQIAMTRLADAVHTVQTTTAHIHTLRRERDNCMRSQWEQFDTLYWAHQYRRRLQLRLSALQRRLQSERTDLRDRREEYRQAYIGHRTLQLLIGKQEQAHMKKQHTLIEDHNDDIGRYLMRRQ